MTELSSTYVTAEMRLVVPDRGTYDIQGLSMQFGTNGVNVCTINLAVGRKENRPVINPPFTEITFERGDEARVIVNNADTTRMDGSGTNFLRSDFTLFYGVVDDFGPGNLSHGQFTIQVRLFGRTAWLASGTLNSSNIAPASSLDTAVFWAYGQGGRDAGPRMNLDTAAVDFWSALQASLQYIATADRQPTNSVAKKVQQLFGSAANLDAATILGEIAGVLDWRADTEPFVPGIVTNLNALMMQDWYMAPFLHRIANLGEMLRFRLVETGERLAIVPYHPFFQSNNALAITPRTYSSLQWDSGSEYRNYSGCVLVSGAGQEADSAEVVGVYKPSYAPAAAFGQVHVGTVPSWFAQVDENMFTGGGAGARSFRPIVGSAVGNRLAKLMAWELNYRNRRFQVTCPFLRADIGPLEAVRVDFPSLPEVRYATEGGSIYGTVESITITYDATEAHASTTYTVGYARSAAQQENIIDADLDALEHPFFQRNYIGGRLDSTEERTGSLVNVGGNPLSLF